MTSLSASTTLKRFYKKLFFIAAYLHCSCVFADANHWHQVQEKITQQEHQWANIFFSAKGVKHPAWALNLSIQPPSQWRQRDCDFPEVTPRSNHWQFGTTYYSLTCKRGKWSGKVRVNRKATVSVVTLLKAGSRHQIVQESDITLQPITLSRANAQAFFSLQAVIGYQLKHRLPKGQVLQTHDLSPAFWVMKHQHITLLASGQGYQVKMSGEALESGHQGDWVRVKNSRSNKRLKGKIIAQGVVQIYP